jgi:2-polyprenyl-6-methoxyphenol hydroxylase-like FAD-dependent oxidoreductase
VRIAINGAGIGGPTLAYWLERTGHEVLLVEAAPALRTGGYVIDFWGMGYDIAERMGLLPRIRELGYQVREVRFVDQTGRTSAGFRTDVITRPMRGRFTSLRRSDLAATIYGALDGRVETIFGDSIAGIEDDGRCVRVTFDHSKPRAVDLVIGADGLHSRVRRLAFGAETDLEMPLGYVVAAFEAEGYQPRDELVFVTYGVPGRQISRFAARGNTTIFLCVFHEEYLTAPWPSSAGERKAVLHEVFAGLGWECERALAAMEIADDLYFDRVSQIRLARWTNGRTALIGDAASAVSLLAGEGTGLAMAQGYVLAGELHRADQDFAAAFSRYEQRLMPFLRRKQATAARFASSFAPRTRGGLRVRNFVAGLLGIPLVAEIFLNRDLRDDITLPDYRL